MEHEEKKKFTRRFRGYCPREVTSYFNQLKELLQQSQQENKNQAKELTEVKSALKDYHAREQSLEAALNQTKQVATEIKTHAEREAQLLVAEAELQAEKILGQAHNRLAHIHEDIVELKRQRTQFEIRLRSLVEAHLKLIDIERERDRDLSDLEDKIKILRPPAT